MNLTARTPSFVSSSDSSNPGRTSHGYQDPGKPFSSDDRSGKPVETSRSDYLQEDHGLYTPQNGEFIGHCHDQETAQLHQNTQGAVETDRKELDKSKQMPAEAQSTDPGGDAEAQVNCRLRTNVKQLRETIV